jgi:hypothetical protein
MSVNTDAAVPGTDVVSQRAKFVTAVAVSAAGLFLVRRIPRPLRPPVEILLAASAPVVARQLSQLGL